MSITSLLLHLPSHTNSLVKKLGITAEDAASQVEAYKLEMNNKIKNNSLLFNIFSLIFIGAVIAAAINIQPEYSFVNIKSPIFAYIIMATIVGAIYVKECKYYAEANLYLVSPISQGQCKKALDICDQSPLADQWRRSVIESRGQILNVDVSVMEDLLIDENKAHDAEYCKRLHGIS